MPVINLIQRDGTTRIIDAQDGWSLMEILRDSGVEEIEGACGGSMACATCHLYVHPEWVQRMEALDNVKTEEEDDILDLAFQLHPYSRLGCQIRMSHALNGIIIAVAGAKIDW